MSIHPHTHIQKHVHPSIHMHACIQYNWREKGKNILLVRGFNGTGLKQLAQLVSVYCRLTHQVWKQLVLGGIYFSGIADLPTVKLQQITSCLNISIYYGEIFPSFALLPFAWLAGPPPCEHRRHWKKWKDFFVPKGRKKMKIGRPPPPLQLPIHKILFHPLAWSPIKVTIPSSYRWKYAPLWLINHPRR